MSKPKRERIKLDGWLAIDKPLGMSSAQVVGKIKFLTKAAKVGHAGTLDPLASGLLMIALGEATKLAEYAQGKQKTYRFHVRFGEATTTDDAEGEVIATSPRRPTAEEINAILPRFLGTISQLPPAYSAIHINGQRAYDLARAGKEVVLEPRQITIHSLVFEGFSEDGEGIFEVECSKGTYVRSLARDIAAALGSCGHVRVLRRTKNGAFSTATAFPLAKLEELVHSGALSEATLPVHAVLDDIPVLRLGGSASERLKQGLPISAAHNASEGEILGIMCDETLVALVKADGAVLRPVRVFNL